MEIDLSLFDLNEKEEKILKAAIKIFSAKGYSAATTSEIAKTAGVAEGTVFNYFKTKKEILRRIMIHVVEIISMEVTGDLEGETKGEKKGEPKEKIKEQNKGLYEMLRGFIRPKIIFVEEHFPIFRIVVTEALYHKDIRQMIFQNALPKIFEAFEVFLKQLNEEYSIRTEADTFSMMRLIGSQIFTIAMQHSIFKEMGAEYDVERELDKSVRLIAYGLLNGESNNESNSESDKEPERI